LIRAWRSVRDLPLRVIGDGALRARLEEDARSLPVQFLGRRSADDVLDSMRNAQMLIMPSVCYEGFPRVFVEALATATPVVASALGGLGELVTPEHGITFPSGDSHALAAAVNDLSADAGRLDRIRTANRARYLREFAPQRALDSLLDVYRDAIEAAA
jgi:glycosyltransferase involved in cell wall biosynthesis